MKTGICPDCYKVTVLTKRGKISRHGWQNYARNKTWLGFFKQSNFTMVETKPFCNGSGKWPLDESRF